MGVVVQELCLPDTFTDEEADEEAFSNATSSSIFNNKCKVESCQIPSLSDAAAISSHQDDIPLPFHPQSRSFTSSSSSISHDAKECSVRTQGYHGNELQSSSSFYQVSSSVLKIAAEEIQECLKPQQCISPLRSSEAQHWAPDPWNYNKSPSSSADTFCFSSSIDSPSYIPNNKAVPQLERRFSEPVLSENAVCPIARSNRDSYVFGSNTRKGPWRLPRNGNHFLELTVSPRLVGSRTTQCRKVHHGASREPHYHASSFNVPTRLQNNALLMYESVSEGHSGLARVRLCAEASVEPYFRTKASLIWRPRRVKRNTTSALGPTSSTSVDESLADGVPKPLATEPLVHSPTRNIEIPTSCDACVFCDDVCDLSYCNSCAQKKLEVYEKFYTKRKRGKNSVRLGEAVVSHFPRNVIESMKLNKEFSPCEIRRHATRDDCWVMAHGIVYDATRFLPIHPAGEECILRKAGCDVTRDFDFHHSQAQSVWKNLEIGKVISCASYPESESLAYNKGTLLVNFIKSFSPCNIS